MLCAVGGRPGSHLPTRTQDTRPHDRVRASHLLDHTPALLTFHEVGTKQDARFAVGAGETDNSKSMVPGSDEGCGGR